MLSNWSDSLDRLIHLLVVFVLALPIGWNRACAEQGAGLRAFPLVAMASCGFVQTAISVLGPGLPNQTSVMQGIITGVGFIGAGAIIKEGAAISGHATAANVWTVGIISAAVGYGYYTSASFLPPPISLS
jgi:putative Mg2+ transporter-C (MgtC) family protein